MTQSGTRRAPRARLEVVGLVLNHGWMRGRLSAACALASLLVFVSPAFAQSGTASLQAPLVFDPKLDNGAGGHPVATVTASTSGGSGSLTAMITVVDVNGNTV